ncbi:hypothetical protein BDF14DRAFT_1791046 [Spinellus fusiger]|nr:hypothetical protein BDF14DRAFT_1791046 [Spinellus fusiger]
MPLQQPRTSLPILDLSQYTMNEPDSPSSLQFLKDLEYAMCNIGFFYISNHGVLQELQEKAFQVMEDFFKLPLEDKLNVGFEKSPHFRGYAKMKSETTNFRQDNREQFDLGRESPAEDIEGRPAYVNLRGPNQWPEGVPEFKETITELRESMSHVGLVLLTAMVRILNLEGDTFTSIFNDNYNARMKLLRYPAMGNTSDAPLDHGLGVGAHKDPGYLTVLLQGKLGGLQVQVDDGSWIDAEPIPNTFIVNIGEILERLTRKHFIATTHRVLNPTTTTEDRFSIPLFLSPAFETRIPQLDIPKTVVKTVISDVPSDQLLQNEVYGENEFNAYCRSHKQVAQKWYAFNEDKKEWHLRKGVEIQ